MALSQASSQTCKARSARPGGRRTRIGLRRRRKMMPSRVGMMAMVEEMEGIHHVAQMVALQMVAFQMVALGEMAPDMPQSPQQAEKRPG